MLAHRLKQLRKSRNLTQEDIAEALLVSKETICRYEKGTREPNISTLTAIADFYKVDFNYLLGPAGKQDFQGESDIHMLQKFHSLDYRGKATVLNVLEHEYVNAAK